MHYLLFILVLILSGCNLIPGTNTVNTLPFNLQQLSIRSNPAANNSSPILVHLVLVREPNLLEKIRNLSGPEYFSAYSQILQDYNNYIIVQDVEILPGEPLLRLKVTYPTSPKPAGAIVFAKYSNSPDLNNRVPVGNNPIANLYLDISGLVSEDVGMNDTGGYNRTPASPNIGSGFNLGSLTSMLSPMMNSFNQNTAASANNAQGNSTGLGNAPNLGGGLGNLSSMLGGGGLGSLFGGNQSSSPNTNNGSKKNGSRAKGRNNSTLSSNNNSSPTSGGIASLLGNTPNLGGGLGNLSSLTGGGGLGGLFGGNQSSAPSNTSPMTGSKPTARGRLKAPNYNKKRSAPKIKKQKSPNIRGFKQW